jgi:DNA polymerase-3 subunit beta
MESSMKLTMEASDLGCGLRAVKGAVERRNTIPILSNVLIRASKDGSCALKGTDLDLEISISVSAQVETAGEITVAAETLLAFVSKLPKGSQVKLEMADERLKIRSGRSSCTLVTLPATDFPDLAVGDMTHNFVLTKDSFKQLFGKTQFAISTEETRYYLNGIYLHAASKDKMKACATDGHRLALVEQPLPEGAAGMAGIIVPRKTVDQALRLVEAADNVAVSLSANKIIMVFGDTRMASKLVDGTFPDYGRVIPQGQNMIALFDRGDVAAAAGRVATVSSDRGRAVKLSFTEGGLNLMVVNPDAGSAEEDVEADYAGAPLDIGLNARYLADVLGEVSGEKVRMALTDPGSPVLIQSDGDNTATFVVMPMRV